jgi:hypothetical protein
LLPSSLVFFEYSDFEDPKIRVFNVKQNFKIHDISETNLRKLHIPSPEHSSVLLCLIHFLIIIIAIIIIIITTINIPHFRAVQPVLKTVPVSLPKHSLFTLPPNANHTAFVKYCYVLH